MSDKWMWIAMAIIIGGGAVTEAVTSIHKDKAHSECVSAYANSDKTVEEIKKLCE